MSFSITHPLYFFVSEAGVACLREAGQRTPGITLPSLGLQAHASMPGFCVCLFWFFVVVVVVFCGYWVLNSGPYACIASTIVTDSYLKL